MVDRPAFTRMTGDRNPSRVPNWGYSSMAEQRAFNPLTEDRYLVPLKIWAYSETGNHAMLRTLY